MLNKVNTNTSFSAKTNGLIAGIAMTSLSLFATNAIADEQVFTKKQVQEIIKETLINDPHLLKNAIIALQVREERLANESRGERLGQLHDELYQGINEPFKGSTNPELTIIYFTDFNCPYCKRIEPALDKLIEQFPQVKVIVKTTPLQGSNAMETASFAYNVWLNAPEKFEQVYKLMMASPRALDTSAIAKVAAKTDTSAWLAPIDPAIVAQLQQNIGLLQKLGLNGTPSLIIGETIIPGLVPYEQLEQTVKQTLKANK